MVQRIIPIINGFRQTGTNSNAINLIDKMKFDHRMAYKRLFDILSSPQQKNLTPLWN